MYRPVACLLLIVIFAGCRNAVKTPVVDNPVRQDRTDSLKLTLQKATIALQKDSSDPDAWFVKGNTLAALKDTVQAIHALDKAFFLQPVPDNGLALANLYAETKNPKVLAISGMMLQKDSSADMIDAVFIKGIYFERTGNVPAAIQAFDKCIALDWKFTDAYIEKGIVLYQHKNFVEALKVFHLASVASNTYPDAYFWMARCQEAMGLKDEAYTNYSRALALDKGFTEASAGMERLK